METKDLLFAHGALCDMAQLSVRDRDFACRLRDVINNFQRELRPHLKPDACDFHVVAIEAGNRILYRVEPIGGWDG